MRTFKNEAFFRLIKLADIGYIVIIYFLIGILLTKLSNQFIVFDDPKNDKKKSTLRLSFEIIGIIWLIIVIYYILRNVVELIPSPFHGLYGYDHYRLKELNGVAVLGVTYIYFRDMISNKLDEFNKRIL